MNEDDDDELDIELPKLRETIRTRSQELKSARADAVRDAGDDEKAKAKAIDDNPVTINPLAFWTARLRNIAAEGIPTWCKLAKIGMLASPTSAPAERAFSILQSMNKAGCWRTRYTSVWPSVSTTGPSTALRTAKIAATSTWLCS